MSRCGNCQNQLCSCQVIAECEAETGHCAEVIGTGATYAPIQARLTSPDFRLVGEAHRLTSQALGLVLETIVFEETSLPITGGSMWDPAAPSRLTASIGGIYLMSAFISVTDTSGTLARFEHSIYKNGILPLVKKTTSTEVTGFNQLTSFTTLRRLNAGDYIELLTEADGSGNSTTVSTLFIEAGPYLAAQWVAN